MKRWKPPLKLYSETEDLARRLEESGDPRLAELLRRSVLISRLSDQKMAEIERLDWWTRPLMVLALVMVTALWIVVLAK